jgi:hypothetical protein
LNHSNISKINECRIGQEINPDAAYDVVPYTGRARHPCDGRLCNYGKCVSLKDELSCITPHLRELGSSRDSLPCGLLRRELVNGAKNSPKNTNNRSQTNNPAKATADYFIMGPPLKFAFLSKLSY